MEALVNEEGLIHHLPTNILASRLLNYPIVGNCILVLAQELMGDEPEDRAWEGEPGDPDEENNMLSPDDPQRYL